MEDGTVDFSLLQRTLPLREQFELAWQKALHGGPEPQINHFLSAFTEPERSALRVELEKIAQAYQKSKERMHDQTQGERPPKSSDATDRPPKPAVETDGTWEYAPDTKTEASRKTTEHVVENPASAAAEGATLDYVPEAKSNSPDSTIAASALQSSEFSLADTSGVIDADGSHKVAGYEILEVLGRGAMGVVYKARQRGLKRVVALKMILAGGHASDLELNRFRTEAEAVAQLQHPNIVQVYEVGEHQGCPFLSLEYVNGGSLHGKIGNTPQPVLHAAQTVQVLAQAMDFAHRLGVIHRDLKPSNVMLTLPKTPGSTESTTSSAPLVEQLYGTPKIADFGLAKKLEEDGGQTRTGTILGTPSYMAPEQAQGKSKGVGPLADQYALGAILYEMLTGRPPFRGESVWDTLEQVRTQEPVPPSRLQPKVARDLETICLKALQKEPHKRYADCAGLAEDLRHFVVGEPIRARPIGVPERLVRWCKRNPRVAFLTGAVFVLLVSVIVGLILFSMRLSREKTATELARDEADRNAAREKEARDIADQKAEEARQSRKVAEEQGAVVLETLGGLVDKVQKQLRDVPDTRELRQDILQMAMSGVKRVADSAKDDRGLQRILAVAYGKMAELYIYYGQNKEALDQYQKAYQICKTQAAEDPSSDKAKGNLAAALHSLGDMRWRLARDAKGAREYLLQALKLRQEIDQHPQSREILPETIKTLLADTHDKLGTFGATPTEVLDHYLKAFDLRKQAVALEPGNAECKLALARSSLLLGNASMRMRDLEGARALFEESRRLREEQAAAKPGNVELQMDLAAAKDRLAEALLRLHQPKKAQEQYQAIVLLYKQALEKDSKNHELPDKIFGAYYGLATAARYAKDPQTADRYYRQALDWIEEQAKGAPQNPGVLIPFMLCVARCGEHERAARTAERVRQLRGNADDLFQIACCYALCMPAVAPGKSLSQLTAAEVRQRQQYQAAALEALRQAKDKGYSDWVGLETDPDLVPIQELPAFKVLLKEFERLHPLPARQT
jgi:serine/threonine-protein kinase